ncbi:MAG: 3-oxoacyl-ACP reductase FabG [Pseudomonadales bacterium]|nr:3-oxoacyl-ACP reductase FabG [Pseudomonadales bacterium]MBO6563335.1 3-oxoacyl-ACP reductase FabG [Pseudomonadales bacterium]MBO6597836.1 3-oxoacyl-ACP reductase FabG [Pseudomonadales bacterium]MBO6658483.1 3-oxoacyl-ACP reductase FabG [Pseudomonadales bacterium]MBO6702342.1 3-oxoacyl-ACP reductase FabG [Pseudomonadales bacterium]
MADLSGKVALISGAARHRGLGRAMAIRLAEDGADVIITGRARHPDERPDNEKEIAWTGVNSLAEEIEGMGRKALAAEGDVTKREDVERIVSAAKGKFGNIDILVNNAGVPSGAGAAPILDMDDDLWYDTVDVNLNGVYLMTKLAGQLMRDNGNGGSIINISSTAGRRGIPDYGAYCATKWAVVGFTQQLAIELAPQNIRVNCIAPGSHATDMMDGTIGRTANRFGISTDDVTAGIRRAAPMGRQGLPSELAASVSFLAGDDSSFMTGQTLNVDGGAHMS